MVNYNPKDWFRFIITFNRADTVRKLLPALVIIGLYSFIIVHLIEMADLSDNPHLKNFSLMHTLLSFVISMLLVFRTNTAYDRWWEGRKLWGALVNNSRNMALKLDQLLEPAQSEPRQFFRAMIPNFAFALKNHLRQQGVEHEFAESAWFGVHNLRLSEHVPQQIALAIFGRLNELQRRGILLPEHLLLLNPEIQSLMDICGACERIKNTPIPFSYSSFIKKFIFIYCISLPLGYVSNLHYLVVPLVVFVFYVLASLEVIAEEIENPFGTDDNDLPLDTICKGIHKTVTQSFDHTEMLAQTDQLSEIPKGFSYEK
ncbi:bestrophin family protein [Spirosoma fluviale]|uniref:Putative membrane protein n=1 Tax=Spirosoma fluviale TaxID=1597977 RepID=A0A286G9T3_9BACT|nr:bestrophin family ion channel [Spirosoma fluviale]SOD92281.1 putative membrane protein [Spirosoma fluviale]